MKICGISLTMEANDIYNENFNPLKKDTEKDTRK